MNINGTIKKLQKALLVNDFPVTINRSQFYSCEQNRFITMISLQIKVTYYSKKYAEWRNMNYEILKSASQIDILLCMVDIYKAVCG